MSNWPISQPLFRACLLGFLLVSVSANSQQKLQIVEKTIEKDIPYKSAEVIKIGAEKAKVKINGWDKDFIKLSLTFSARHESKDVATKELSYMKYAISKDDDIIEFRNGFDFPADLVSVKSSLTVIYEIHIPADALLSIEGKYSDVELVGLRTKTEGAFQFGSILVKDIKGSININSSFADITAKEIDADFYCRSNNADIVMETLKGSYRFNSTFTSIHLTLENTMKDLTINAFRTGINLVVRDMDQYNYTLFAENGRIEIEDENNSKLIQRSGTNQSFNSNRKTNKPLIKISTTYNSIHLK